MRIFKRKRWLVKNTSCDNMYAGANPATGWSTRDKAKRFKDREAARQVALLLTFAARGECEIEEV